MSENKTVILAGLFIDSEEWLTRTKKFLDYYRPLKADLGFTEFVFIDNGSEEKWLNQIRADDIHIHHFPDHLPKGRGARNYPYAWRNLYTVPSLFATLNIDKAYFMDTDTFVLSDRLTKFMKAQVSGWTTFWCSKYSYPSAELSILNSDALLQLLEFMDTPEKDRHGQSFENVLPYTVNPDFNVNRWGEDRLPIMSFMDAYTQCPTDFPLDYPAEVDLIDEMNILEIELSKTRRVLNDYRTSAVKATAGHTLRCMCNYCLTLAKHGGV